MFSFKQYCQGRVKNGAPTLRRAKNQALAELTGVQLCLLLRTAPGFLEAAPPCPLPLAPGDIGAAEATITAGAGWAPQQLEALLGWLERHAGRELSAQLQFPPSLGAPQRAWVHTVAQSLGLATSSSGVASDRRITVLSPAAARAAAAAAPPAAAPDEKTEHKAAWLYRWAREEGHSVSRDECREMVQNDLLPDALRELWIRRGAEQKCAIAACDAAEAGDAAALRALLALHPRLVDVHDELRGAAPIHCAVAAGELEVLELLLAAGAAPMLEDRNGRSAIEVARRFEHSDCEGRLAQWLALHNIGAGDAATAAALDARAIEEALHEALARD